MFSVSYFSNLDFWTLVATVFSFLFNSLAIWVESISMLDSIKSSFISFPLTVIVVGCEFSVSNISDSFKNFVDFQNRFFDFDSKSDLCDIFVLKRLVWSWMFVFLILALFFEMHFQFCYLFFQFFYLLSDEWIIYILEWLIFWLFCK